MANHYFYGKKEHSTTYAAASFFMSGTTAKIEAQRADKKKLKHDDPSTLKPKVPDSKPALKAVKHRPHPHTGSTSHHKEQASILRWPVSIAADRYKAIESTRVVRDKRELVFVRDEPKRRKHRHEKNTRHEVEMKVMSETKEHVQKEHADGSVSMEIKKEVEIYRVASELFEDEKSLTPTIKVVSEIVGVEGTADVKSHTEKRYVEVKATQDPEEVALDVVNEPTTSKIVESVVEDTIALEIAQPLEVARAEEIQIKTVVTAEIQGEDVRSLKQDKVFVPGEEPIHEDTSVVADIATLTGSEIEVIEQVSVRTASIEGESIEIGAIEVKSSEFVTAEKTTEEPAPTESAPEVSVEDTSETDKQQQNKKVEEKSDRVSIDEAKINETDTAYVYVKQVESINESILRDSSTQTEAELTETEVLIAEELHIAEEMTTGDQRVVKEDISIQKGIITETDTGIEQPVPRHKDVVHQEETMIEEETTVEEETIVKEKGAVGDNVVIAKQDFVRGASTEEENTIEEKPTAEEDVIIHKQESVKEDLVIRNEEGTREELSLYERVSTCDEVSVSVSEDHFISELSVERLSDSTTENGSTSIEVEHSDTEEISELEEAIETESMHGIHEDEVEKEKTKETVEKKENITIVSSGGLPDTNSIKITESIRTKENHNSTYYDPEETLELKIHIDLHKLKEAHENPWEGSESSSSTESGEADTFSEDIEIEFDTRSRSRCSTPALTENGSVTDSEEELVESLPQSLSLSRASSPSSSNHRKCMETRNIKMMKKQLEFA